MSITNVNDNLFEHPAKNSGSRPFVIVGNMNHSEAFDRCKIRNLIILARTMGLVHVAVNENYPHLSEIGEALYLLDSRKFSTEAIAYNPLLQPVTLTFIWLALSKEVFNYFNELPENL